MGDNRRLRRLCVLLLSFPDSSADAPLLPDNATVNVETDQILTCAGVNFIHAAAESKAFPALYVYNMLHAYALSYYNPFGLCSFPVGQPQPYYRCHSGDLYEVRVSRFLTSSIGFEPAPDRSLVHITSLTNLLASTRISTTPTSFKTSGYPLHVQTIPILRWTISSLAALLMRVRSRFWKKLGGFGPSLGLTKRSWLLWSIMTWVTKMGYLKIRMASVRSFVRLVVHLGEIWSSGLLYFGRVIKIPLLCYPNHTRLLSN